MRVSSYLATVAAILILAGAAGAIAGDLPGDPGSDARRRWCAAQLASCLELTKRPGFLGGPRNFCNEQSGGDCVSACQQMYGGESGCLARPKPLTQQ